MKSLNKTQFKLIYNMYNGNIYNQTLRNARDINQWLGLVELYPDIFSAKRVNHSEYTVTISFLKDLLPLIKYNSKFEKEI